MVALVSLLLLLLLVTVLGESGGVWERDFGVMAQQHRAQMDAVRDLRSLSIKLSVEVPGAGLYGF